MKWIFICLAAYSSLLKNEFPDMKGFSPRNLKYMRKFAAIYPGIQIVQQAVAQIPWGHIIRLMELVTDTKERDWYINKTIENGWSRKGACRIGEL
jgi:predicted nuclease of restriction endonuclease-like (RecB) superfamily